VDATDAYCINRFELLRMGYTSRQLDEDIWLSDQQLLLTLESARLDRDTQRISSAVAMAFGASKESGTKDTRKSKKGVGKHGR